MKPLALRNILLATDLDEEMAPALRSAAELAELSGARLHIVHSVEHPSQRQRLEEKLKRLESLIGQSLDISILAGPAPAVITEEAIRTQADVIALGRHRGKSGRPGATADRVVRTAHVPCLILSQPISMPLDCVLVPVDVDAAAGPLAVALTWASALRRRHPANPDEQTCVHVLHVRTSEERTDDPIVRLREEVDGITQRIAPFSGVRIERQVAQNDDVAACILEQADQVNAALLVLGTRSQRIKSDPLGNVSSAVVRNAARPLLLVPPEVWRPAAQQLP